MDRWAVFDIDGTLLPGASLESRFINYFRREHLIPYRNLILYLMKGLAGSLSRDLGMREDAFKGNKMYLRGLPAESIQVSAQEFFRDYIKPLLFSKGLETIENFRNEGYKILLLSGSLDILVANFERICNPDKIICTELEVVNNRLTGRINGLHPYSTRKKNLLLKLQDELQIDYKSSIVFANHHTDVHHMELFGEVVAVNSTPELKSIALERGWRIEYWD